MVRLRLQGDSLVVVDVTINGNQKGGVLMAKKHHFYKVDFGNETRIMGGKVLKRYYETEIDHAEYDSFESWLWDMRRCGLITEI